MQNIAGMKHALDMQSTRGIHGIDIWTVLSELQGFLNASTGHKHTAAADDAPQVANAGISDLAATKLSGDIASARMATNVLAAIVSASGIVDANVATAAAIANTKLANPKATFVIQAHKTTVAISQTDVEVFEFTAPAALTVTNVQVYCTATAATATVDVKEAGTTILTAIVTPVAGAVAVGAITDAAIASGAAVTVHVTTSGSGTITDLSVSLVVKMAHVA